MTTHETCTSKYKDMWHFSNSSSTHFILYTYIVYVRRVVKYSDILYIDCCLCIACIGYCKECSFDDEGNHECMSCIAEYYHEEGEVCVPCSENCLECSDRGKLVCLKCETGYFMNNGSCEGKYYVPLRMQAH